MPDSYRVVNNRKFMWDGYIYSSESDAKTATKKYSIDNFETHMIAENGKFLVYTRRVVKANSIPVSQ